MKKFIIASLILTPILVHAADNLISLDATNAVYPGELVMLSVAYEATTDRDVAVSFQLDTSPWTTYGYAKVSVPPGSGSVDIYIGIGESTPIATDAYKYGITMLPSGGTWADRLDTLNYMDVDCVEAPPPPETTTNETLSVIGPPMIVPGTTVPVYVNYVSKTGRVVRVGLQQDISPWTEYASSSVSVPAGSGSVVLDLTIDSTLPIESNAYRYESSTRIRTELTVRTNRPCTPSFLPKIRLPWPIRSRASGPT